LKVQKKSKKPSRIIVISDSFHTMPEAVAMLNASGHAITYVPNLTPWSDLAPGDRFALKQAHAVIMGRVLGTDASALSLAPNLRVIALHTSGSDNVDLDAATRQSVLVTNVKGVNADQCAEFAIGLMLCVVRQILTGDRTIRAGLWASRTQTSMDVFGASVGVIGFGQIAKAFVKRARSFGVRILVHTRTVDTALAREFGIKYTSLNELLKTSDIVCMFASLTKDTRHMIGKRELSLMKQSAFLINIARGDLIDQEALLEALRTGQIAGAGLDVFEHEPAVSPKLIKLAKAGKVTLLPHMGSATNEGRIDMGERVIINVKTFMYGHRPPDRVLPSML